MLVASATAVDDVKPRSHNDSSKEMSMRPRQSCTALLNTCDMFSCIDEEMVRLTTLASTSAIAGTSSSLVCALTKS